MFITAICVLFLVKLRWPKNKSLYDAEAPAVDRLWPSTLRGTKTTFLIPQRYDEHPTLLIWEYSPPPGLFVATCFETSEHQLSRTLAIGKENGHNQPIFLHKRLNNGFTNYCRY